LCAEVEEELTPPSIHDDPPEVLYHYTNAKGFKSIIESGQLWATHYGFLNDTSELAGERLVTRAAAALMLTASGFRRAFLETFITEYDSASLSKIVPVCVTSFCEEGDLLSQWRAYGSAGSGYSLGFSRFDLPRPDSNPRADVAVRLIKCDYNADRIQTDAEGLFSNLLVALDEKRGATADPLTQARIADCIMRIALRSVATIALRYKHDAFSEEKEWRLILLAEPKALAFRESAHGLLPFVPLDQRLQDGKLGIATVIVGPTQHPTHSWSSTQWFLDKAGYGADRVVVAASNVPLRGL